VTDTDPRAARLRGFGTTVFAEMSALAASTGAVNLGQGFPDTDGPSEVLEAAVAAIRDGANQYPPGDGIPSLRRAIAEHQRRFYGLDLDPDSEVLVTTGATEAIAAALLGLLDPGDEVVVFEPMFDTYAAGVAMAGAVVVPVLLAPDAQGRFRFDPDELTAAVGPRTRVILLNTPHNPTGKVFTADEMDLLAETARRHDLIVITDEVYEHLVFPGHRHVPMATLPGMAERTLTISSAGKTFRTTGWKIGWVTGPTPLVTAVRTAKQYLTYVSGAPFQPAIAVGLALDDAFFAGLGPDMADRAARLGEGLRAAGLVVHPPEATYFTTVDVRPLRPDGDGHAFCLELPERCGVVAIPNAVFYERPEHGRHLVRFACCKTDSVLDEAVERLAALGR